MPLVSSLRWKTGPSIALQMRRASSRRQTLFGWRAGSRRLSLLQRHQHSLLGGSKPDLRLYHRRPQFLSVTDTPSGPVSPGPVFYKKVTSFFHFSLDIPSKPAIIASVASPATKLARANTEKSRSLVERSTIGNRVGPKRVSRVRIPPSPPKSKTHCTVCLAFLFSGSPYAEPPLCLSCARGAPLLLDPGFSFNPAGPCGRWAGRSPWLGRRCASRAWH